MPVLSVDLTSSQSTDLDLSSLEPAPNGDVKPDPADVTAETAPPQPEQHDSKWDALLSNPKIDRSQSDGTDQQGHELWERSTDEVNTIQLRQGHKEGDPPANYVIDKDGNVKELIPPDKLSMGAGDDAVVIEYDNSAADATIQISAAQRSSALELIGAIKAQAANAHMAPDIPSDLYAMLEPLPVPPPRAVMHGGTAGGAMAGPGAFQPGFSNGNVGGMPGGRSGFAGPSIPNRAPRGSMESSVPQGRAHFNANSPAMTEAIRSIVSNPAVASKIQHVMADVVSKNEGVPTQINWNDNGAGVSVGMFQWNQRRGELPSLMTRMAKESPEAFSKAFGPYASRMASDENFVRRAYIGPNNELGARMQAAMNDPSLQKVQFEMAAEKVAQCAEVGRKFGLTSEQGVAVFTDMVNQLGMGAALPDLQRAAGGIDANNPGASHAITARLLQLSAHHAYRGQRTQSLIAEIGRLDGRSNSFWQGEAPSQPTAVAAPPPGNG